MQGSRKRKPAASSAAAAGAAARYSHPLSAELLQKLVRQLGEFVCDRQQQQQQQQPHQASDMGPENLAGSNMDAAAPADFGGKQPRPAVRAAGSLPGPAVRDAGSLLGRPPLAPTSTRRQTAGAVAQPSMKTFRTRKGS